MQRRIAIIGANGFVGRHLLSHAVSRGFAVNGVVRSDRGARIVAERGGRPCRLPDLGAESTRALLDELSGCDALVYTASVAAGPAIRDRTDPQGLVNVLEACRAAGVPNVVFFSGLGIARYGMNPHCTNPYFLAKMAGEVALFRSSLAATVFRPSYVFGPGDQFLSPLIRRLSGSEPIEIAGEGAYRLQPISVRDTARAVLGALDSGPASPRVVDLVGPEIVAYRDLLARLASILGCSPRIQTRPVAEAMEEARGSGFSGLRAHDLDCLLCDEVADAAPVERLAGGPLDSLDDMITQTKDALSTSEAR